MSKTPNPVAWGYVEDALSPDERRALLKSLQLFFDIDPDTATPPPEPATVELPPGQIQLPAALSELMSNAHADRLLHATGRSTRDLITLRSGKVEAAPDLIARPASVDDLTQVLAWADRERVAVIPFGGGSSVVGGINAEIPDGYNGCVTVDLQKLNQIREIDDVSLVVDAEAGILGPDLDAELKAHGLGARHFPQSYFHSTLGGWAATRGAGHFSTQFAKIEDRIEGLEILLPDGRKVTTGGVPASSIGPDPGRLWLGSEGTLGIITSVRLRVVRDPRHRAATTVSFKTFEAALAAARDMLQGGLYPSQLRILDPFENMMSAALQGKGASGALMVLAWESDHAPLDALVKAAVGVCEQHGGQEKSEKGDGSGDWRNTFFRQPYIRDALLDYGIVSETFETAVTWKKAAGAYESIRQATLEAVLDTCGRGGVNCRTTHAYPDGISLYFSFFGKPVGDAQSALAAIKTAASEAVIACGGTMSHHHAMGRDHQQWAEAEIPSAFRDSVRAAKGVLDPNGIMNPGLWFRAGDETIQ